jgi:hypothetical protein
MINQGSGTARLHPVVCLFVSAALAVPLWACATRTIDTKIIDRDGIDVFLRHQQEEGEEVERGFSHPAHISPEHLSLILASIRVERSVREGLRLKKVSKEQVAFEAELTESLASAISEAFAQASSKQEIVVRAVRNERRLAVFQRTFVTSFITFMENDSLYLDLSRIHWEMPKDDEADKPPMPKRGENVMKFRVLPGPAARVAGPQLLAVSWRDLAFDSDGSETPQPAPISEKPDKDGESRPSSERPDKDGESASSSELPPDLSSASLRELADLEEAREQGDITESYYQRQRQKLLQRATQGDTSR